MSKSAEDEMFVLGDVSIEHTQESRQTSMGTAAKLAAVAMLAAGIPGAVAVWKLPEILAAAKPDAIVPSELIVDTNTDTNLEVGLGGGEVVEPLLGQ